MKESGLGSSTLRNKSLILIWMFVKQELLNSLPSILTVKNYHKLYEKK